MAVKNARVRDFTRLLIVYYVGSFISASAWLVAETMTRTVDLALSNM